ncbi:MAG: RecX family transcriptional regulator [Erysipelotrichaceae bacterium]|nr:RecX family transcriptional regulator [Erysipelotrichaceae bacterium]
MIILEEDKIMIPIEAYFSYRLKDRKEIDEELIKKLKDDERYLKAYRSCLRKLSVKDHTVRQISDHLCRTELNEKQKKEIIDKLTAYGMLDDEKYAENKIAFYDRSNLSVREIKNRLKKDGISERIISRYIREDEMREKEKALLVAEKYAKSIKNKSLISKKQSIVNKLLNAGYSYEMSKNVVNTLEIEENNEIELLQKEFLKSLKKYAKKYEGYELRQRIYGSLLNKGFGSEDIKRVMEENDRETSKGF